MLNRCIWAAVLLTAAWNANAAASSANAEPSSEGKLDPDNKVLGIAPVPLKASRYVFDTAEQHGIRVSVLARGLKHPYAVAPLPNGDALVTERSGRLLLWRGAGNARLLPVSGLPTLQPHYMRGGLHDLILHPEFARNRLVYFTFNRNGNPPPADARPPIRYESRIALFRGRLALSGQSLEEVRELFSTGSGPSSGSRIAFGSDGHIYLTTGSPFGDEPQRLDSLHGKVLRLRDDGSVPPDNPFAARPGARPEIYTYGHRDQLGIASHPVNGAIVTTEMGPNGGDEINLLKSGANYGWPLVSFGRHYVGPRWSPSPVAEGIEAPLLVYLPSIAPFGAAFYTGSRFPRWQGNLFVASAQRGQLPHTGGLERIVFNERMEELRRESLLTELRQRIGDVRAGFDELLYVLTEEDDGALLRIEPNP